MKPRNPELRIIACAYDHHSHSSFIDLLEAVRGRRSSPIKLYPLRISLLSGNPSALFMLSNSPLDGPTSIDRGSALSFPPSPLLSKVTMRPLHSTITSLDSIHGDISKIAMQKRAALILLPFSSFNFTQKVLDHAPCSVGILVDRGSMAVSAINPSFSSYKVMVFFVGGPDDREALFTALRMTEHPRVAIKVVRLITSSIFSHSSIHSSNLQAIATDLHEEQKLLDDEAISMIRETAAKSSFVYSEKTVVEGETLEEALQALTREMTDVNMYIVGRGQLRPDPHPQEEQLSELGVFGDILASSSSGIESHACILVVQQHDPNHSTRNENTCKHLAIALAITTEAQASTVDISGDA